MTGRIDDHRTVGIQSPQSIDQRKGFRCALHTSFTDRMVPHESGDVCLEEKRSDRGSAGIERELRSPSEIENAFLRMRGWCTSVEKSPATIEDRLSQCLRDIDRRDI